VLGNNDRATFSFGLSPITYVRDLGLSIVAPTGLFPVGSVGPVDFVLANNGPDTDPGTFDEITVSDPFLLSFGDDPRGVRFALAVTNDPDCTVAADDIEGVIYQRTLQVDFRPVAAGTSRTCSLVVTALPGAVGVSSLRFTARSNHPGEIDPNPGNNSAVMSLQHTAAPASIPALSPLAMLLLASVLLATVAGMGANRD
jgi:hypothetical protein